jgi:hypothetical protein
MAAMLELGVTACLPTGGPVGGDRPVAGATAGASGSAGAGATAGMSGGAGDGAIAGTTGEAGAGSTAGSSGASGGMSGGAGGFQPGCHIDCFGGSYCSNGAVVRVFGVAVECGSGGCPARGPFYTCRVGCTTRSMPENPSCPNALCTENAPKLVGDPCATDDDCRPTVARLVGGVMRNLYLACDRSTGTCVARAEPSCAERCRSDDECPDGATCVGASCDPFGATRPGTCSIEGAAVTCPR